MMALFKHRNFALLWSAGLISLLGDWMLITVLPFYIYSVTGSALATGGWLAAYLLPGVLFSSVAGIVVDRLDRRKLLIASNLLQLFVIPLLLLVQSPELIWLIYVVTFFESTLSQFAGVAESATLPSLVPEDQLVAANSLNGMNDNLARILGPALGGLMLTAWGLEVVIIVDALSYLVAGVLLIGLRFSPVERKAEGATAVAGWRGHMRSYWEDFVDGLGMIRRERTLRTIFGVFGLALFADAILSAILVVFVQEVAGLGADEFGWLLTIRGVSGLVGGALIAQYGEKIPRRLLAGAGLVGCGAIIVLMTVQPTILVLITLGGLVGIPVIAYFIAFQTMLQENSAAEYRGRVFGTLGTTASLLMLIGSLFGGATAELFGVGNLTATSGWLYILAGLLTLALLAKLSPKAAQEQAVMLD